jgi:tetratricopeptide (TPR) repeat protein
LKQACVVVLLAALGLAACTPASLNKATVRPASVTTLDTPDSKLAAQQLTNAMKLGADKNFAAALEALRAITQANGFTTLSADFQYRTLAAAGQAAYEAGETQIAHDYLSRVIVMPQATAGDWYYQLHAADKLGLKAEMVNCWTTIAERWPERIADVPDRAQISGRI